MIFFKKKRSEKLTQSEQARAERLQRQLKPTTQNTLAYTSLFEEGLMHVVDNHYSMTFKLGDASYSTAEFDQQLALVETHAKAYNAIDTGSTMQMLIINKRVSEDVLEQVLYTPEGDGFDDYRMETNERIQERFAVNANNFEVEKYITICQEAENRKQAQLYLQDVGVTLENIYKSVDVSFTPLNAMDRLNVFSTLLLGEDNLPYSYNDLRITGLTSKSFIAPDIIEFNRNDFEINTRPHKVMYIKHYPKSMEDDLIRELTSAGIEVAISIHGKVYDTADILEDIEESQQIANVEQIRAVKRAAQSYVSSDFVSNSQASEDFTEAGKWRKEIKEFDQKVFRGFMAVYFSADNYEDLKLNQNKLERAGRKAGVRFSDIYYHQDDALNTILPIGLNYLDLEQNIRIKKVFPRSMTTANLATQVPFASIDYISKSPTARYYGQNQASNNMIAIDRKKDLNTPSGIILGGSGSGKSVTAKNEIISTLLKYKRDKVIIIDPEDEVRQEVVL
ncbi:TPA: hypothetical protein TXJ06_001420 [Streptococcus suis]|nr:hypothetical protein [Streptococcus suis]HEL1584683.1 hypothetical protein [Streptococcus suis]